MTEETENAMLRILIKIQEEAASFRRSVEQRLDRIEEVARKQRRDVAGMLVMMKGAAGIFEERMTTIEQRVGALEQRQGLS